MKNIQFSWKRILLACVIGMIFCGVQGVRFLSARSSVQDEWARKLPGHPRKAAEMRGLLQSMITYPDTHASFIPQSAWDNELCAGNVVNAANFIIGEKRLVVASAWKFEQANKSAVTRIYDREQDFRVEDDTIVETVDRGFWFSNLLEMVGEGSRKTSGRMYVVGYHYKQTNNDPAILEAREDGGTLNSHLLLLLGRDGGRWYGYHFLHDSEDSTRNPFEVIDMGECDQRCMPERFDLVYIWEVHGTQMPAIGAPIRMIQNSRSYAEVTEYIGTYGAGRLDHIRDTLALSNASTGDHFPTVVREDALLVDVSPESSVSGAILGLYKGIPVYRHRGKSRRGLYGLEFQCVEFVNRFYAVQLGHKNLTRTGDADTYWYGAQQKGLIRYRNGSKMRPAVDDILTFDPPGDDDVPGHVGIVYQVTDTEVCIVQQNAHLWRECFELKSVDGLWTVEGTTNNMPAVGWSRRSR